MTVPFGSVGVTELRLELHCLIMKHVLRLHAVGDLRLHEEPETSPAEGEERVRVTAVGICGSDLHWFEDGGIGDDQLARPLVLGHELAGVIDAGPRAGLRVAIDPAVSCGACFQCARGHPNLCERTRFAGHGPTDGGLQTILNWPSDFLFPIPDTLTDADGAILEPLGVAVHAVDLAHLRPGVSAAVFGGGPIGLLTLQVARASGAARLYAVDPHAHRREAALGYGADAAFAVDGAVEAIVRATGRGVDVAFEAAGSNEAVVAAMEAVRPGGRVVLIGIPSDDRTAFPASLARRKGLTIVLVRRMRHVYPRALALVETGRVDVRTLATHTFPLDRAAEAFETARRREGLKVIVVP